MFKYNYMFFSPVPFKFFLAKIKTIKAAVATHLFDVDNDVPYQA